MHAALLIVLLTAHLALAYWCGHAEAVPPQLAMLLVQGMAVWAVFTRYRRSPSLIRLPWLLLAVAVLMQMLWDGTNALAAVLGDKGGYLAALATVLSGLYVVPCMFMSTRSFTRHEPRTVAVLDLVLLCMVAVLVYQFFTTLLSGPLAADPASIHVVVYLADAIDFSLAAMALLRLFGARSFRWRYFYYVAGAYLLVNAAVACIYNRIEMHGLPWWAGSLIDIPHALLVLVALRRPPRWLRTYHPSLGVSQTIASFAPIMLATMVVMLAISTSRIHYGLSLLVGSLAVLFYGLRVAFIQSRHIDQQRAVDQSTRRLEQQVGRDPLTGIANRAALDTRLREVLEAGHRTGGFCSLLMVDIDYFKQYNDSLGHVAGDACLVRVADALSHSVVRAHDLVARYGGEEFTIVLADTTADMAQEVARRLIAAIEHLHIAHPACPLGRLSISIGVASQTTQTPIDPMAMLDEADHALYRAKRNGRNRFETAAGDADPPAALRDANSV
ncbi:GGDEF domain-containing protein [Rhodanobacter sp. DHB23]|uniref:GGDEF domain-containing protein n=1 Tax=Rhodanobacter sp. DHB23 TaxID=2775923 RepID=UPI00178353DA|nr:GGDEF domain-containing protein [Rhodanobacter sp. DHB23]MBD8873576.1 GGDEF domain-containing protein [Rhodanobacter sp. DHB23]